MKLVTHLLPILLLAGCTYANQSASTPFDSVAVEQEVRQTLDDYFAATRTGGITAGFQFLDRSETFFWVPPGYQAGIDYDSVISVLTTAAPGIRSVDNHWTDLTINPLNDTIAVFHGEIRSAMTDTGGASSTTLLLETGILVKRPVGWKLLGGQTRVK